MKRTFRAVAAVAKHAVNHLGMGRSANRRITEPRRIVWQEVHGILSAGRVLRLQVDVTVQTGDNLQDATAKLDEAMREFLVLRARAMAILTEYHREKNAENG